MAVFRNKKVWHSNLKAQSPLVLMFTSDPMDSKFDEGTKFVYFSVRGDNTEGYYLIIENERIAKRITEAPKRTYIQVSADGEGESADISISRVDTDPSDARRSGFVNYSNGNILEDYTAALRAAEELVSASEVLQEGGADTLTDVAASLFIQWSRTGFVVPLTPDMAASVEEASDDDDDDDEASNSDTEDDLPF